MRLRVPLLVTIASISLIVGSIASIAYTQLQTPTPTVYVVSFMKVEPAKIADYLRLEREIWKPIHQERIRSGRMKSWSLYRVRFPYGAKIDYNFVTVNGYASLEDNEKPLDDVFAKVHPSMTPEQIRKQSLDARTLQTGEAWDRLEHIE